METAQLVLSQFKNFLNYENWIKFIPAKIISKRCELVKLYILLIVAVRFCRHNVYIL